MEPEDENVPGSDEPGVDIVLCGVTEEETLRDPGKESALAWICSDLKRSLF
jgi:hypothetical protein